ncbi:hypothetical protein An07g01610 [Aspergillus niger]|uniref:Uncharacterized protein n=2 Tax=Aspergillus niger TaxID=5061 RepID=A2QMC5_ASPNC|nr:hypothetical protein An07g01610 [Aspergillus niger]CAK96606.1 hypothetical protein An07g01610 [Aspergillus niger]
MTGPSEQGPPDTPPAARLQAHEGARWMLDAGWWNQERTKSQIQGKEEEKKPKPKRGRPGRNKRNQTGSGGPLIFWCSFGEWPEVKGGDAGGTAMGSRDNPSSLASKNLRFIPLYHSPEKPVPRPPPRPKRCRRICIAAAAVSPRKMDGELHTGWPCSRQRQSGDPPCSNSRSVRDCPRPIITVHVSVSVSTETLQCGEKGICRLWEQRYARPAARSHLTLCIRLNCYLDWQPNQLRLALNDGSKRQPSGSVYLIKRGFSLSERGSLLTLFRVGYSQRRIMRRLQKKKTSSSRTAAVQVSSDESPDIRRMACSVPSPRIKTAEKDLWSRNANLRY